MRVMDVVKSPLWALELATGAKSFRDNPILGSRRLNEMGLHLQRIRLAERMGDWRRSRLEHLLPEARRAEYATQGFLRYDSLLSEPELAQLREEVETTRFDAYDMRQGNAVTRFIPLSPEVLRPLPVLRRLVRGQTFQNSLRYLASSDADPLVYLHVVMTDPAKGQADPQTLFHSDTFHATAKCWFFLYDVPMEEGPFTYVPGSHRLTEGRLEWERQQSLEAATAANRLHARGSFRISGEDLSHHGFERPVAFDVPGNTLVVADTHGFHARGRSTRASVRVGIYGSLRRNPFSPIAGLDPFDLPGLRGRQAQLFLTQQALTARLKGRRPAQPYVGKVLIRGPSPL